MALINDFKLLNLKCMKHFELAMSDIGFNINTISDDNMKRRFGFYYLSLQYILNIDDYEEITKLICDCEFNTTLFGDRSSDEGVDAVHFDKENKVISVFNFKFKNKFSPDNCQSINDTLVSTKFFDAIATNEHNFNGKVEKFADEAIENCFNMNEIWETRYFVVSNDSRILDKNCDSIRNFENARGIKIIPVGLDQLAEYMDIHPLPINAQLLLGADQVIQYKESNLSSDESYNFRLPLLDLLRITCNDPSLRENPTITDESVLSSVDIDVNILYENVRGYILRSKFNAGIIDTLSNEPENFYFYNNGITIVAENIVTRQNKLSKKYGIKIENFQVLNGGQTLRSIHKFSKQNPENLEKLSQAYVFVRLMIISDNNLKSKISEFSNSQNAISQIDLKSMRDEQVKLQMYLDDHDILYVRKSGDTGSVNKNYVCRITLQELGQLLYAKNGNPGQVSNKKKDIFTKEYDRLFLDENLLSEDLIKYIKGFDYIKKTLYKSFPEYDYMVLKVFFIIYLSNKLKTDDYASLIKQFEDFIYPKSLNESTSRLLIKPQFMEELNSHFNIS